MPVGVGKAKNHYGGLGCSRRLACVTCVARVPSYCGNGGHRCRLRTVSDFFSLFPVQTLFYKVVYFHVLFARKASAVLKGSSVQAAIISWPRCSARAWGTYDSRASLSGHPAYARARGVARSLVLMLFGACALRKVWHFRRRQSLTLSDLSTTGQGQTGEFIRDGDIGVPVLFAASAVALFLR